VVQSLLWSLYNKRESFVPFDKMGHIALCTSFREPIPLHETLLQRRNASSEMNKLDDKGMAGMNLEKDTCKFLRAVILFFTFSGKDST
jgi:hypothetical protein